MTNTRDQVKMLLFDLSIDRNVRNELGNIFVVPALTPDVANPDQNLSPIDNPGKLEPGLNCCIAQQAEQPMDRGNMFDSPCLVRQLELAQDVQGMGCRTCCLGALVVRLVARYNSEVQVPACRDCRWG